MLIRIMEPILDEDNCHRDPRIWEVTLWEDHRGYPKGHPKSRRKDLLVIGNPGEGEGWFLSIDSFKSFLRQGIIKIVIDKR